MHTVTQVSQQPKLLFRTGENRGKVLALEKDRVTIGRDGGNDIELPEDTISSFHAAVVRAAEGSYWLEDCGSKNGTFLGSERVQRVRLSDGDVFCLCRDGPELQFLYGDPELPTLVESTATVFRRTHSIGQCIREVLPRWGRDKSHELRIGCVAGVRALDHYGLELESRRARTFLTAVVAGFFLLCVAMLATTVWIFWRHGDASRAAGSVAVASPAASPFAAAPERLEVSVDLELEPIYASLFLSYRDRPIGKARIENRGAVRLASPRLEFAFEGEGAAFLVEPFSLSLADLAPGERREVSIAPKLSASVLSDYTREVTARAVLHASPEGSGILRSCAEVSRAVFVYGRHVFSWEDPRRVAAFIDPDDPAVRLFLANVWPARPRSSKHEFPPERFVGALALLTAVAEADLRYLPDATNPISARTDWKANDRVSYPLQTFASGSGDCDDLSVLCCALLEAAGIPTAFAVGRGHVFFLFDSGMPSALLGETAFDPQSVIDRGGRLWIPVEATELARAGASFAAAWAAAWTRREAIVAGEFEIVEIADAWKTYQPLNRPPADAELERLRARLGTRDGLATRVRARLENVRELFRQNLAARVEGILAEHGVNDGDAEGADTAAWDEVGLLYARSGLFLDAADVFERSLFAADASRADDAPGAPGENVAQRLASLEADEAIAFRLLYLGICLSLGGRLDDSVPFATAAAGAFPPAAVVERGEACLRVALIHRLRGDLSAERRWLADAFLIEPSLRDLYASLLRGDGTVAGPEEEIRDFLEAGLARRTPLATGAARGATR